MQSLKRIPELNFVKGMNNTDKPEQVKEGQCVLAQNCLLGDNQIVKGPGAERLFNIGTSKKCLGAISTNSEMYAAFNESGDSLAFIYRYTGSGNPVAVSSANLTASTDVEFVDAGTGVYVMNGTDATGKLVGSTYTTPAGMPIGKYGAWVNNRLYILTAGSRLYYSNANDPDTFGASDYIDIIPRYKSVGTGLGVVGGVLVIGKRDNMVTFNGFTADDFTVKSLAEDLPNYGCTSHRSMVNIGDDLLFMSFAGQVPHIRSLKRTSFDKRNYGGVISKDIEGTMKNINQLRLDQVAGGFDGRYAWWAVCDGTATENNMLLCYDTHDEGWTVHKDHQASVFFRSTLVGGDRLYYGRSDASSKVCYLSTALSSIDGETIPFKFVSRSYRPQTSRKSKFKYLYVTTGSSTNVDIVVSGSPDGYTFEEQDTISPNVSGSVFPMTFPFNFGISETKPNRVNLKVGPSYSYQIQFEEESAGTSLTFPFTFPIQFGQDTDVIIKEYELMYYMRGLRDA